MFVHILFFLCPTTEIQTMRQTYDSRCNHSLLSTAQEKADSLNSKLDPQITQNYRELMIEN